METAADLLALIHRGIEKPVTMELKRVRSRESESRFGWVIQPRLCTVIEASWLTIHRDVTHVHAHREGEDVLRGSGAMRWLFEGRKIPVRVAATDLVIINGTRWFLDPAWEDAATDWKEEWESQVSSAKGSTELPDLHDAPDFVSEFPPQPENPRRMHIFIGDGSLAGKYS